jgi:N6-adenosine-specific RNA methylase IME4
MTVVVGVGRMPLDAITVGERHRKDVGDIDSLARGIDEIGLLQPIVVNDDGHLIAGQRRLLACASLGWTDVPVHVVPLDDILAGELQENGIRKPFLLSEVVAIAKEVEDRIEVRRGRPPLESDTEKGAKFAPFSDLPKRRQKVAAYAGISHTTLTKATDLVKAAQADPITFGPLVEQMDRTGKVNGVYKRKVTIQKAGQIRRETPPLPTGPFRVIVADPPWSYGNRVDDPSHRAANPYPQMTTDAISGLAVGALAHDDALLWLWTTNAHMREAFAVVDAWGFTHKTILTWVKDRMGTGDWLRGQTEHCLLAVRGRPVVQLTNQTTVLHAPMRDHSRKPDEFYALVEALCPGAKVELFSRQQRPGWAAHGDEVMAGVTDDSPQLL